MKGAEALFCLRAQRRDGERAQSKALALVMTAALVGSGEKIKPVKDAKIRIPGTLGSYTERREREKGMKVSRRTLGGHVGKDRCRAPCEGRGLGCAPWEVLHTSQQSAYTRRMKMVRR